MTESTRFGVLRNDEAAYADVIAGLNSHARQKLTACAAGLASDLVSLLVEVAVAVAVAVGLASGVPVL